VSSDRIPHLARPAFDRPMPAHVTLKVKGDVPSLRSSHRFAAVRACFAASRGLRGTRLVEFAVLGTHLHLVIEAESSDALSRGMQGLCVRLARSLNRLLQRKGSLFNDHYHSHLLKTPAEVAHALRYVLDNAEKHYGARPGRRDRRSILVDCCTSSSPELRDAVAERPVLTRCLNEIDEQILRPHQRLELSGNEREDRGAFLDRAPRADDDLNEDELIGALDAEIAGIEDE
jgi:REP element-mobilizing transposase RayT